MLRQMGERAVPGSALFSSEPSNPGVVEAAIITPISRSISSDAGLIYLFIVVWYFRVKFCFAYFTMTLRPLWI